MHLQSLKLLHPTDYIEDAFTMLPNTCYATAKFEAAMSYGLGGDKQVHYLTFRP